MASVIAAGTTAGTALNFSGDTSGALVLQTNGTTTAVTIDTSQNVGIGIAPTSYRVTAAAASAASGIVAQFQNSGSTGCGINFAQNGVDDFSLTMPASTGGLRFIAGGGLERMRIDSSGAVIVGATATGSYFDGTLNVYKSANIPFCAKTDNVGAYSIACQNTATSGNNSFALFLTEATPTIRGSISYNRAGGLTVFNTTSDYRSKTVKSIINNALGKLALLKPCTGRMNGATEDIDFFVAHELQAIVPSAVSGEKDEVDAEGNPKYQMVDKSAIIPLLTAAIQEQQALIIQLQADVAALKGVKA